MTKKIDSLVMDVRRFHRGCKSRMLFDSYRDKIYRCTATDGEKKIAILEIQRLMEVKP